MEKELVYGPFLEIWKPVKDYPDYDISNYGRVKSFKWGKEKIRKQSFVGKTNDNKYLGVTLHKNGKTVTKRVHRLVAQYIPNPHNYTEVNHKNGDYSDNYHLNLEWTSPRENCCHRSKILKKSSKYIGVCWSKRYVKWQSEITVNSKNIYLGRFNTEEEAYQARCNYEKENGILNRYL